MLADIPAVAYTASWGGFLSAEFTANFKIDFFTSSCPFNAPFNAQKRDINFGINLN
jgi:hypothetical protein